MIVWCSLVLSNSCFQIMTGLHIKVICTWQTQIKCSKGRREQFICISGCAAGLSAVGKNMM